MTNALSLFSGIGGLDLAAEAAGIRTIAMCEKDAFCRKVLRKHWPDVPIFEDIKTLRGEDIGAPIDVIHGGPPCQPASLAGRRRGQSDERYLWGDVFRIVADVMPRFYVLENVLGIISIAGDDVCKSLESLGYSVGICCFEAAAVGALHRRMRVFFVGHAERGGLSGQSRRRSGKVSEDGCQDVPDSACGGWESWRAKSERFERKSGAFYGCEVIPDADSERKLQQIGRVEELRGRTVVCSGREPQSLMGGVVDGRPDWLDGYWRAEPDIPRVARGVKDRVNRLKALGNAVVPAQAYPIFRAIVEVESAYEPR